MSAWLPPEVTHPPTLNNHWDRSEISVITAVINNKSPFPPPRSTSCDLIGYRQQSPKKSHRYTSAVTFYFGYLWEEEIFPYCLSQIASDQLSKLDIWSDRLPERLSLVIKLSLKVLTNGFELIIFRARCHLKKHIFVQLIGNCYPDCSPSSINATENLSFYFVMPLKYDMARYSKG